MCAAVHSVEQMANIEVQLLNYVIIVILKLIMTVIPLWNNVSFEISFFLFVHSIFVESLSMFYHWYQWIAQQMKAKFN